MDLWCLVWGGVGLMAKVLGVWSWIGMVQGNGIYFLGYGATLFLGGSGIRPQYAQKTNAVPLLICALCKVAERVGGGVWLWGMCKEFLWKGFGA